MNYRQQNLTRALTAIFVASLAAPSVEAAVVYLRAESFSKSIPGAAASVTMWGYSSCEAPSEQGVLPVVEAFQNCSAPSSPGPEIVVPAGDSSLTIHLRNDLAGEATSLMIPGATKPMTPVSSPDDQGRNRIRAFDVEAAANGGTQEYTWTGLRPGSYLYQSASHVQLQVQMGLYGAMVHEAPTASCAVAPCAYSGVPYDRTQTVVFSEIDPALHDPSPKAANLTVDGYRPTFFLINGEPYIPGTTPDLVSATAGEKVMLRLINAGLQNRAPQLLGGYFDIVGEDANQSPIVRRQYNTLLPAGKTLDVLFTPASAGTYTLYDRRFGLVNGSATNGGQLRHIAVSPGAP